MNAFVPKGNNNTIEKESTYFKVFVVALYKVKNFAACFVSL